jgi:hypothetical protein
MVIDETLQEIRAEAERAHGRYGPPVSTHESLGVLMEEFDELKEAIHANAADRISHEAIQLASVAYRLALELRSGNLSFHDRSGLIKRLGCNP